MTSKPPPPPVAVRGLILSGNPVRLWGMSATERLRRSLRLAGIETVETTPADARETPDVAPGRVLVVSDDWVFDTPLIHDLARRADVLLLGTASGAPVAANVDAARLPAVLALLSAGAVAALPPGLEALTPAQLSGAYNHKLRKREQPYLMRLTHDSLPAIEQRMFGASYKGVTDVVTKYFWPRPARAVTKLCAQAHMTPNQVTFLGLVLTIWSFWLFWHGHYALGLASGWLMTFLDTVDGKLARVTLTSSRFGNAFDHGIDLIHPPFWWWAWIVGLQQYGLLLADHDAVLAVIVIGYVVQRMIEGTFQRLFGMHVHVWRRFDSRFRLWTARRNPNLLILTPALAFGRPDLGIWLVAAWTLISLAVHALQIVQALAASRHGPLESWLSREA